VSGNSNLKLVERTEPMDTPDPSASSPFTASQTFPDLMTESELIQYLRIPEVSKSKNYHNVVENLKRMRDLPRIRICGQPLYPLKAIREWIEKNTEAGR
jgi:hypothetical protein